jgi:hypothetical protein
MMNILDTLLIYLFEFDFELIQNQIQINKFQMKDLIIC